MTLLFSLLLLILAAFTLWLAAHSTKNYFLESTQRLNAPIAMYMAENFNLLQQGEPDPETLTRLSHHAMTINPGLEIYLLDSEGAVIAPTPQGGFKQPAIRLDLDPIIRFTEGATSFPLYGDYPAEQNSKRTFSAHPLTYQGQLRGYIYVVFGGEKYKNLLERLTSSYVLRDAVIIVVSVLILTFLAGLMVFSLLTRRLRRLKEAVTSLSQTTELTLINPHSNDSLNNELRVGRSDEIDALTIAYNKLTQQLAEQYNALARSDRGRRELFANISHDLRTPLTALSGYLETLQLKLHHSDKELQVYADIAYRQTQKLRELVAEMLELSIINSGEATASPEAFSLIELVYDIAQDFQLKLKERQITLEIHPHSQREDLFEVHADISLIQRVFENLLNNAIDHTPIQGWISIEIHGQHDAVSVCVADSGAGISEHQITDIFTRYHSGHTHSRSCMTKTSKDAHTGLGLAIVKGILDLHGCAIEVNSQTNKGTQFDFRLPRASISLNNTAAEYSLLSS